MSRPDHALAHERRRLAALRKLDIFDAPSNAEFSALTELAATYFSCPIALISMVDKDLQRFKSPIGMPVTELPRAGTFCDVTVAIDGPLVVEDAALDARFASGLMVVNAPHVRFYAGIPVRESHGYSIGNLCVADVKPRAFGEADMNALAKLARLAENIILTHERELELTDRSNQLEKWNTLFRQSERMVKLGTWEVDLEKESLTWSDGVYNVHRLPVGTPVSVAEAIDYYVPSDRAMVEQAVAEAIAHNTPFRYEANIATRGGTRRIRSVGEVITDSGGGRRLVGMIKDIDDEHAATERLKTLAFSDSQTGALNRLGFDQEFARQLEACRTTDKRVHLAILDLDGLKAINDVYGHLSGDFAIRHTAVTLSALLPAGTQLARIGGDEFAIFGGSALSSRAFTAALETIERGFDKGIVHDGHYLAIGISGGYAVSRPGDLASNLLSRADAALYHSKRVSPGTISRFPSEMNEQSHDRNASVARLRGAIANDQIVAHYQPIVRLSDGAIEGCEALMRVRDKDGVVHTAEQFALAFEDAKISRKIGAFMVKHTTHDLATMARQLDRPPRVSFNVTAADLLSLGGVEYFHEMVAKYQLSHSQFCIELTESMLLVNDRGALKALLVELRKAGTMIALDDFGTGYSSLTHLRDFPIDFIKIDKSFVARLESEHESRLIVQSLIQMAANLNIKTVAEGIETEGQADLLRQIGCEFGQGFLFAKAMPIDRLIAQVKAVNALHTAPKSMAG
jgi:diguanylate cyclase (GGDEF)-like protein